jgi:hypothetical protein
MDEITVKASALANLVEYFFEINADVCVEYENDDLFEDAKYLRTMLEQQQ